MLVAGRLAPYVSLAHSIATVMYGVRTRACRGSAEGCGCIQRWHSPSQSPAIMSGGFGPVARDGFGVGYSLTENELGLHITDYGGRAKVWCSDRPMRAVACGLQVERLACRTFWRALRGPGAISGACCNPRSRRQRPRQPEQPHRERRNGHHLEPVRCHERRR